MSLSRLLWTEYIRQVRRSAQARGHRDAQQRRCERLVLPNLVMVDRIARTVARKFAAWIPLEDFIQAGRLGLVEAARRYPGQAQGFERYAYRRVRGAMIDAHKRRAYREELHESIEGTLDRLGFLPASIATDLRPRPDELLEEAQRRERLIWLARRRLPEGELQVFLATMAGMDVAEIAVRSDRSVAWVRSKLGEVKKLLRAAVQGRAA